MNISTPHKFDDFFNAAANEYGLNPNILKAIGIAESSLRDDVADGTVKGPFGEVGTMQFTDGTAKDYGLIDEEGNDFRTDPEKAIFASASKLSDDIEYFKNQYGDELDDYDVQELAIRAYNGGRGNADKDVTARYAKKVLDIAYSVPDEDIAAINEYLKTQQVQEEPVQEEQMQEQLAEATQPTEKDPLALSIEQFLSEQNQTKPVPRRLDNAADIEIQLRSDDVPPKKITDEQKVDLTSDENFNIIKEYLDVRLGENEDLKTRDDYIQEFLYHMRYTEWNASLGGVPELLFVTNATEEQALIAARAHELYDRIPNFYDGVGETVFESLSSAFVDPTSWIGFGVGAVFKHKMAKKGINEAIKAKLKQYRIAEKMPKKKRLKKAEYDFLVKEAKEDFAKETTKYKRAATLVGAGVEGLVGVQASATQQVIDQRLTRVSKAAELENLIKSGVYSVEEANAMYDQTLKDTELSALDIAKSYGFYSLLGGIGAHFNVKDISATRQSARTLFEKQLANQKKVLDIETQNAEALLARYESALDYKKNKNTIDKKISELKETIVKTTDEFDKDVLRKELNDLEDKVKGASFFDDMGLDELEKGVKSIKDQLLKIGPQQTVVNIEAFKKLLNKDFKDGVNEFVDKMTVEDFNGILNKIPDKTRIPRIYKDVDLKSVSQKDFKQAVRDGRVKLDELLKAGFINDTQFKEEIFKRSMLTGLEIMINQPNLYREELLGIASTKNTRKKTADILRKIVSTAKFSETDDFVGLMKKAGYSDAKIQEAMSEIPASMASFFGDNLGFVGVLTNKIKRNVDFAPESQKIIDKSFGNKRAQESISLFGNVSNFIKRLETESKAIVVSGLATTIRNVMGTSTALTMEAATRLFDTALYSSLKITNALATGIYKPNKFSENIGLAMEDIQRNAIINASAISNLARSFRGTDQLRIGQQFDMILREDPRTQKLLLTSLQEVGEKRISWFARTANTLNVAQDAYFRRAIFVNSVQNQLAEVGMDLNNIMARGQTIDKNIIQRASKDALLGTFAYKPPAEVAGKKGEAFVEGLGGVFIDTMEKIPGSSLLIPFPRFVANAIAFQYKYSLFQFGGAADSFFQATTRARTGMNKLLDDIKFNEDIMKQIDEGKIDRAKAFNPKNPMLRTFEDGTIINPNRKEALIRQEEEAVSALFHEARKRTARGAVGAAMLAAAYKYREENQDTDWFNITGGDGSVMNIAAVFPIAPFLALADLLVKIKEDPEDSTGDIGKIIVQATEAIGGMKLGTTDVGIGGERIVDLLFKGDVADSNKILRTAGELLGDFGNRFQQPFQPVYGYFDALDVEYQKQRDQDYTQNEDGLAMAYEVMMNRIVNRGSAALGDAINASTDAAAQALGLGEVKEYIDNLIPTKKVDMPEKLSTLRYETPVTGGGFFSQILGVTRRRKPSEEELHLRDLDISIYPKYGSTGDIEFDRSVIQTSIPYLIGEEGTITNLMLDRINPQYSKLNKVEQKLIMEQTISDTIRVARASIVGTMQLTDANRYAKRFYRRMKKDRRRAIDIRYKELTGKRFGEDGSYIDVFQLDAEIGTLQSERVPFDEPQSYPPSD